MPVHRPDIELKFPDATTIPLEDLAALSAEQLSETLRLVVSQVLSGTGSEVQVQVDR